MFSPALTDGALGDTLYFHSYKNPGLVIDIVQGKWTTIFITTRNNDMHMLASLVENFMKHALNCSLVLIYEVFFSDTNGLIEKLVWKHLQNEVGNRLLVAIDC